MASCTQIERFHQAYIDDELSDSQRVILDEHVAQCPACYSAFRSLQSTNAELFEQFSPYRLGRDLSGPVMQHLPEMDGRISNDLDTDSRISRDMTETNRRLKNRDALGDRLRSFVPLAAAVLLVVLGAVIRDNWPEPSPAEGAVGVVTNIEGGTVTARSADGQSEALKIESYVTKGARYRTGDAGRLMLTLAGPTQVKLNSGTTVLVHNDRMIEVEGGQAFFDVAPGGDLFKVITPNGDLTVYGTVFDVQVDASSTRVLLAEGEVGVQHSEYPIFKLLQPNNRVDLVRGVNSVKPAPADVTSLMAWSSQLKPEEDAYEKFLARIDGRSKLESVAMGRDYIMKQPLNGRHLEGIRISWVPQQAWNYCGIDVLVFNNESNKVIFHGRISPEVFLDNRKHSIELLNHTGITPADARYIRVEPRPDCPRGGSIAPELDIRFMLLPKGATR